MYWLADLDFSKSWNFFRLGLATFVNQINLGEIGPNLHQRSQFEGI